MCSQPRRQVDDWTLRLKGLPTTASSPTLPRACLPRCCLALTFKSMPREHWDIAWLRSLKENIEKEHQYPANAYECLSCIPHSGHANDNTRRKFRSGHAKVAYACFQIRNTFSYFPSHLTATPNHVLAIIWSIATLPWTFRTCPLFPNKLSICLHYH